jgi:Ca2+-binding RTX toxin-like protein
MKKAWAITAAVLTLAAGGIVSAGPASAATPAPFVVDFTGDTAGAKPDGYSSPGKPQVTFYDTSGTDLYVGNFATLSHGQAIYAGAYDSSALDIRLAGPTNAIRFAFGNDDPSYVSTSDLARLRLYRGSTLVDQVDVNVNANSTMDQTIGISGPVLFNRAIFQYVDDNGVPVGLGEIVDDIVVNPLCTITGTAGNNGLVGTAGNDVICGDAGNDTIRGRGGDDLVYAGPGRDVVKGGSGRDTLNGGKGKDSLLGGKGRDTLKGGPGNDRCDGGTGHDSSSSCEHKVSIP